MKTLYLSTHNQHKKEEIENMFKADAALSRRFEIKSLTDLNFHEDIAETSNTLEGNALQKAECIYQKFNVNCFSDDTGLEVAALHNRPGIYSARYANLPDSFEDDGFVSQESLQKPDPTFAQNIDRLLSKLENKSRKARFRTVICLILDNRTYYFEGIVDGEILLERQGEQGFGYDPIFRPQGFDRSFAQLSLEEKNQISHRGRAVKAMMNFLRNYPD